ncbi:MAG: toprim domain-containing protein [Nanoarchaeota archaeon]|nr:toprim domain-containing protein [Nanoarchaeota archaeon]
MKYNKQLLSEIARFKDYVIIVEGKKDVEALKSLGFEKVYAIHLTGVPLRERVEQIMLYVEKKERVCILTDLDKRGKQLYEKLKPIFQELGAKLDSTFRGILIKSRVSHVEGIPAFMNKVENIQ